MCSAVLRSPHLPSEPLLALPSANQLRPKHCMISARVAQRCLRKLGDDAEDPAYIFTQLRVGYRMPKGEESGQGTEPTLTL